MKRNLWDRRSDRARHLHGGVWVWLYDGGGWRWPLGLFAGMVLLKFAGCGLVR